MTLIARNYDEWKTTPPEAKESVWICDRCGERFQIGDEAYFVHDEVFCPECAFDFLRECKKYIKE